MKTINEKKTKRGGGRRRGVIKELERGDEEGEVSTKKTKTAKRI